MTRAEEAADKIYPIDHSSTFNYALKMGFIEGYEKAEHDTIEQACKWLSSHLPIIVDFYNEDIRDQADRDDFIKSFRKDMEEGKV